MNNWFGKWRRGSGGAQREVERAAHLKATADQAVTQREYDLALPLYEESLTLYEQIELPLGVFSVRYSLGYMALKQQDHAGARLHFEACVNLARTLQTPEYLAASLHGLAACVLRQGENDPASRLAKESLQLYRSLESADGIAGALQLLGSAAVDRDEARDYYQKSLQRFRDMDNRKGVAAVLCSLGFCAVPDQDCSRERAYLDESLPMHWELEDRQGASYVLNNLGDIERYEGNHTEADALYRESLRIKLEVGDEWAIAYTLEGCAGLAAARNQGERAARLFGAAAGIRERLDAPLEAFKRGDYEHNVDQAKTLLNGQLFQALWNEGKALSVSQAVVYASSGTDILDAPS